LGAWEKISLALITKWSIEDLHRKVIFIRWGINRSVEICILGKKMSKCNFKYKMGRRGPWLKVELIARKYMIAYK